MTYEHIKEIIAEARMSVSDRKIDAAVTWTAKAIAEGNFTEAQIRSLLDDLVWVGVNRGKWY